MAGLKVLLFGATGMVGQAVLQQWLQDPEVERVRVIGRSPCGLSHPKLDEALTPDLADLSPVAEQLKGFDACFFPLGISSVGLSEEAYAKVSVDLTLAAARAVLAANPGCAFAYVSGAGTDETEKGRVMWARVKGRTENALLAMGFQPAVMIRLGGLVPPPGFRSRVPWIRWSLWLLGPLMGLAARHLPGLAITPQRLAKAVLRALRGQAPKPRLEPRDLSELGS